MRRLWLLFAQTVTVCLGILFIVATLRPEWLHSSPSSAPAAAPVQQASFAAAVAQATPSVVNVYTRKHVNVPLVPLPADPELERLFRAIPGDRKSKRQNSRQ